MANTCHERPYRSCVQPYLSLKGYSPRSMSAGPPLWDNFSHIRSTSALSLQAARNDTDGLNLNSGPTLMPANFCPASSNSIVMTEGTNTTEIPGKSA